MPELPEVETIVRRLKDLVVSKQIASIDPHHPKSFVGDPDLLRGQKIMDITRRAKIIRFHLTDVNVLVHLKMTGQLIYMSDGQRVGGGHPTADWTQQLPSGHTRITLTFEDATRLFFNDQRLFGWWRVMNNADVEQELNKYGPDIIDPQITVDYLYEIFQRRNVSIKQVIMDGKVLAGVGNIYACDALNLAQIAPTRPARTLSHQEVTALLESMRTVIDLGIKLEGATMDHFVHVDGLSGQYQTISRVYNKTGEPCPNCGQAIKKIKIGGRGTYFCPSCQK